MDFKINADDADHSVIVIYLVSRAKRDVRQDLFQHSDSYVQLRIFVFERRICKLTRLSAVIYSCQRNLRMHRVWHIRADKLPYKVN